MVEASMVTVYGDVCTNVHRKWKEEVVIVGVSHPEIISYAELYSVTRKIEPSFSFNYSTQAINIVCQTVKKFVGTNKENF